MTEMSSVTIQPTVSWPRRVRANTSYLMTVDVELVGDAWPYEREEYVIGCVVDGTPWSEVEPLDAGMVVLHCFGGTYGPARFAVHAGWRKPANLRLTLLTAGGLPFCTHVLRVERDTAGVKSAKPIRTVSPLASARDTWAKHWGDRRAPT